MPGLHAGSAFGFEEGVGCFHAAVRKATQDEYFQGQSLGGIEIARRSHEQNDQEKEEGFAYHT